MRISLDDDFFQGPRDLPIVKAAKEFVEEVRIKVTQFNHDRTRCLQVLITGNLNWFSHAIPPKLF